MNSLASISALRQFLGMLGRVGGDKTVILISGGWPLDERDEISLVSTVAAEASAARATVFSIFVPTPIFSADRRTMTSTPLADNYLYSGPLETLAAMTGGGSFRAEVAAESAFERLGRELAGYYRIGIEKDPADADAKSRRLKVQVLRASATVRARDIFDVRTYEDRDWAARLATAIDGPVIATDLGLRVTSYLSADPEDSSRLRVLVSGEATPRATRRCDAPPPGERPQWKEDCRRTGAARVSRRRCAPVLDEHRRPAGKLHHPDRRDRQRGSGGLRRPSYRRAAM